MNILDFFIQSERRDAFTKSLEEMRYCDWVIHKKLGEANGLMGCYIVPARGAGKSLFYHECIDADDENSKHITFTRTKDNPKPDRTDIDMIKAAIIDRDIYCPDPINKKLAEEIGEYVHEAFRRRLLEEDRKTYITTSNPYDWKPVVRPDAYVLGTKVPYILDPLWAMRPDGSFKLLEVSLIPNPDRN